MNNLIYLDNAATTLPDVNALTNTINNIDTKFFNPSAIYKYGIYVKNDIDKIKEKILLSVGLNNNEYDVICNSGGTESNNIAILSFANKKVFLTDYGEHSSVYNTFLKLKNDKKDVDIININKYGGIDVDILCQYLEKKKYDFITIMHVNNETGYINDVNQIASIIKTYNKNTIIHIDGVQAYGKINYKLSNLIDLYSISAHKINGLKGTGFLIKKKQTNIKPIFYGGSQEIGYRPGTENTFGIYVFEYCLDDKFKNINNNIQYVSKLKNMFIDNIKNNNLITIIQNDNCSNNFSPYILSLLVKGIKSETLLNEMTKNNIIIGNGSACSSKNSYNRVILSCGYDKVAASSFIRISFSVNNTCDEIIKSSTILNNIVEDLWKKLN